MKLSSAANYFGTDLDDKRFPSQLFLLFNTAIKD